MAFDEKDRQALAKMVSDCRRLLTADVREQLQARYQIQSDGRAIALNRLVHLDDRGREVAQALRQWLDHLTAGETGSAEERQRKAFRRVTHETAFTYLNRLAALRMCEERGIVIECVRRGMESDGFALFETLSGQGLGDRPETYRAFLECLFDELAVDLGVLFDRRAPHSLIFPSPTCLQNVLGLVNQPALTPLWEKDEAIGWMYQDFNDEDERREMRKSPAPRNAYELAVRNQFFTPRYIVQFLTDNTLGRIWYEMHRGQTSLTDECRYLVRRPDERFLGSEEQVPTADSSTASSSREDLLRAPCYIPHRPKRDPRDLKILDPACGSGHFLLYAFDLLEKIYEEAWHDSSAPAPTLAGEGSDAPSLRESFPSLAELRREAPRLILKHNLYGIEIDPRAAQIAALALWLRAQRTFKRLNLKPAEASRITQTNIVCAEPMPGEADLFEEFIQQELSGTPEKDAIAHFIREVFNKMKLASEAGSLLMIEEEIRGALQQARGQWAKHVERAVDRKGQELLFSVAEAERVASGSQQSLPFSEITDEEFWDRAEEDISAALRRYTEQAGDGHTLKRGLFSDDAAQGFAFIDVCRNRFDVVLMNPPFGDPPESCERLFAGLYDHTKNDLYAMFYDRTLRWLAAGGRVGAITNRTWVGLGTFEGLRANTFGVRGAIEAAADLGSFVLEAQVETLAAIVSANATSNTLAVWIRLLKTRRKEEILMEAVSQLADGDLHPTMFLSNADRFSLMPKTVYGYWMSEELIGLYKPARSIKKRAAKAVVGVQTSCDFRFLRLAWEVDPGSIGLDRKWPRFAKGGEYSPFFDDIHLLLNWQDKGTELIAWGRGYQRNIRDFGLPGVTWPRRTTSAFGPRVFPAGCAFADKGPVAFPKAGIDPETLLGVLVTRPTRLLLSVRLGAGDNAPGSASKSYEVGLVEALPYPRLSTAVSAGLGDLARSCVELVRQGQFETDETTTGFSMPVAIEDRSRTLTEATEAWIKRREDRLAEYAVGEAGLDQLVAQAFGFTPTDLQIMGEELELPLAQLCNPDAVDEEVFRKAYLTKEQLPGDRLPGGEAASADVRVESRRKKQQRLRDEPTLCRLFEIPPQRFSELRQRLGLVRKEDQQAVAAGLLSWLLGAAFGRWDVRFALNASRIPPLPDPFAPLPPCPPGMLTGANGLPPERPPEGYPLKIVERGIIVDDPGLDANHFHRDDLVRRIRELMTLIWHEEAEVREQEACEILGVGQLRDYFRNPALFFDHHLSTYSKSRRQAPIYWPLSTASGSYTVWLYYPRLKEKTLFDVLNVYLESKLKEVRWEAARAEEKLGTAKGADAALLRDQVNQFRAFGDELQDLKEEVARVASLPYKPDLHDGIVINAAPLHKMFRHRGWASACEECWKNLQGGGFDWSHLGLTIWPDRVREKCKKDRSLAVAHGLEDLCEIPARRKKQKSPRAKKKGKGTEADG